MRTADATDDDWPALWPILRAVARAGDTFCWPRDVDEQTVRAEWMAPAPNLTLVLRDGPDVLGTSVLHPNQHGPGSHVANASFAVDPAARGRGAGRRLAEDTLDRARAEGYRSMQFNAVVQTNTGAVRLWKSLGFQVLATVPEAFRHPTEGFVGLHLMYLVL
jgi:ribosomal protein S18 acetylase RimI-like enzyme